ncbi:hypothetical protein PCC9214_05659 [Planktothrix tepida]|uniref:Uncharacterized protein n=1 Tax=Planktothrix tepida PCC 9214 TaxID=671072 RepID=A0A1J1LSH8_9CYAN|nr:TrbI/VirB10 family protein [Planktothrix tepida]CAD5989838.1 hypothetical protein PCC9214_05659 [Planktothrix tepida]CUR35560.1 conserved hypothetical protein [Planktothrix tepida PCC 9214]
MSNFKTTEFSQGNSTNSSQKTAPDSPSIDDNIPFTQWNEARMAELLGLRNSTANDSANLSGENQVLEAEEGNVISQSELFQSEVESDPLRAKTEPSFSSHPLAKFGLVGLGTFAIFFVGGLFLHNIMSTNLTPLSQAKQSPEPPHPLTKPDEEATETAKLKTELALSAQAEQLAALNRSKSPKNQKLEPPKSPSKQATQSVPISPPTSSHRPVSTLSPRPTSPETRYITRPIPVPAPSPSAPSPVSPTPQRETPQLEEANIAPPIDPMEQWMALKQLGSYGEIAPEQTEIAQVARDENQPLITTGSNSEQWGMIPSQYSHLSTVPKAVPVKRESSDYLTIEKGKNSISKPEIQEDFLQEEQNIIAGVSIIESRNFQVGQQAEGTLITPVISMTNSRNNSANRSQKSNPSSLSNSDAERFLVRLNQSLVDASGVMLLPPETLVVFEVNSVHQSGMVDCNAVALILDGNEYLLPADAISIRGIEGNPLMAQKYDSQGSEIAKRDASTVLLGSLANVGRVLNQPRRQEINNLNSILGSQQSTRIEQGDPNLLGAVLEGGLTPLLQQIQQRNRQAIAEIQSRPPLWYIKPNQKVSIFINRSFDL